MGTIEDKFWEIAISLFMLLLLTILGGLMYWMISMEHPRNVACQEAACDLGRFVEFKVTELGCFGQLPDGTFAKIETQR